MQSHFPQLLQDGPGGDPELQFQLAAQRFIELVRGNQVDEALEFAQVSLANVRPRYECLGCSLGVPLVRCDLQQMCQTSS